MYDSIKRIIIIILQSSSASIVQKCMCVSGEYASKVSQITRNVFSFLSVVCNVRRSFHLLSQNSILNTHHRQKKFEKERWTWAGDFFVCFFFTRLSIIFYLICLSRFHPHEWQFRPPSTNFDLLNWQNERLLSFVKNNIYYKNGRKSRALLARLVPNKSKLYFFF